MTLDKMADTNQRMQYQTINTGVCQGRNYTLHNTHEESEGDFID